MLLVLGVLGVQLPLELARDPHHELGVDLHYVLELAGVCLDMPLHLVNHLWCQFSLPRVWLWESQPWLLPVCARLLCHH